LIMACAMPIYVGETSFTQLDKVTDVTKAMVESWTVNNSPNTHVTSFDPNVPVFPNERMSQFNNNPTREEYLKYSWLFGK